MVLESMLDVIDDNDRIGALELALQFRGVIPMGI